MHKLDVEDSATMLVAVYLVISALYFIVPGRWVDGYVLDASGRPLRYHLNGLRVLAVAIALYVGLAYNGVIAWDIFYVRRVESLALAFAIGMIFTFALVLPAPKTGKGLLKDLYLGRLENPQAGRIDAKMYLYLVGAVMLELNLLSFFAHHVMHYGFSPSLCLYVALFTFFLTEYLFFERVHLYTYDFVAERVGFKLGWGCLVFYPFFYCVGLWFAASEPAPTPATPLLVAYAALFFVGWSLARGANMQKYYFKTDPARQRFGPFPQTALTHGDKRVLISGFWGVSRHVNYLGEICMACALALCAGHPGAWLYPLYYVALLIPRQLDDDARCAQKYGPMWDDYRRAVPYRIIPWVY